MLKDILHTGHNVLLCRSIVNLKIYAGMARPFEGGYSKNVENTKRCGGSEKDVGINYC